MQTTVLAPNDSSSKAKPKVEPTPMTSTPPAGQAMFSIDQVAG